MQQRGHTYATSPKNDAIRVEQASAVKRKNTAALLASVEGTIQKLVRRYGDFASNQEALEDLYAAGSLGAVVAAGRFDETREATFNTYAIHWIRAYIVDEMFRQRGQGRLSVTPTTRKIFFWRQKAARVLSEAGQESTVEAVAQALGVKVSTVQNLDAVFFNRDASCEAPRYRDQGPEPFVDESAVDPVDGIHAEETAEILRLALGDLDFRSRRVVEARFYEGKSQQEVAEEIGLTRQRVSQIEVAALRELRDLLDELT